MNNIANQLQTIIAVFQANLPFILGFIGILWAVQILNVFMRYRLNALGLYPRSPHGLVGIVFTPFLHGNFSHLLINSVPLFVFGSFLLLGGHKQFFYVSGIIVILGGFLVWLFGRKAVHIGSSSLVMGYFSYLIVQAYFHPSVLAIAIAITTVFYFGSLFLAIFPGEVKTSWEGHLFGFAAGLAAVYLYPYLT